jgi:hypothetical protein
MPKRNVKRIAILAALLYYIAYCFKTGSAFWITWAL